MSIELKCCLLKVIDDTHGFLFQIECLFVVARFSNIAINRVMCINEKKNYTIAGKGGPAVFWKLQQIWKDFNYI